MFFYVVCGCVLTLHVFKVFFFLYSGSFYFKDFALRSYLCVYVCVCELSGVDFCFISYSFSTLMRYCGILE